MSQPTNHNRPTIITHLHPSTQPGSEGVGGGGGEIGRGRGGKGEAGLSNSINNRPQPQSSSTTMVGGGEGGEGTTFSEQSPNNKTRNQPDKPDQLSHPLLAREKQGTCCTHRTTPGYTQHTTLLKVGAFGPDHNHLSSPSLSPHHTTPPHHNPGTHLILSPVPSLLHPFNHHPFQTLMEGAWEGVEGGKEGLG